MVKKASNVFGVYHDRFYFFFKSKLLIKVFMHQGEREKISLLFKKAS